MIFRRIRQLGLDTERLAARVRRLEDLDAVRATWLDYCNRLDAEDFDALAAVFTEDAEVEMVGLSPGLDGRYRGRRSIIEDFYARTASTGAAGAATEGAAPPAGTMTGHLSTNMQIELDGDDATTLAYFFEIVDDNLVLIGAYQHRMRRGPDRWRIARLRITVRYRTRIETGRVSGRTLREIQAEPI